MAESTVLLGMGTTVGYDTSTVTEATLAAGTYTDIIEITDVELPGLEVDDIDATHLGSLGRTKEHRAGLKEPGTVSGTCHLLPATNYEALRTLVGSTRHGWQFVTVDDAGSTEKTVRHLGYLQSYKPGGLTPDGKRTAAFTIQLSGQAAIV